MRCGRQGWTWALSDPVGPSFGAPPTPTFPMALGGGQGSPRSAPTPGHSLEPQHPGFSQRLEQPSSQVQCPIRAGPVKTPLARSSQWELRKVLFTLAGRHRWVEYRAAVDFPTRRQRKRNTRDKQTQKACAWGQSGGYKAALPRRLGNWAPYPHAGASASPLPVAQGQSAACTPRCRKCPKTTSAYCVPIRYFN